MMTPYFQTFQEFVEMNGHGIYVWLSYGISFLCIAGLIWYTFAERKKTLQTLRQTTTRLTNKQRQQLNKNTTSNS